MNEISSIISKLEDENGREFDESDITYALSRAKGETKADAYRQAKDYDGKHAGQNGHKVEARPEIQALIDQVKEYSVDMITDDYLRQILLREATEAEHSRDRISATEKLMKSRGMLKDVVEQTNLEKLSDEEYLDKIERQFGSEARQRAAQELGME